MKALSGKFIVRLTPEDHGRLKKESFARGLSLNELCQEKLALRSGTAASSPIAGMSSLTLQDLRSVTRQMGISPSAIILFGSFARQTEHTSSDVDLLFVLPSSVPIDRSLYLKWDSASGGLRQKVAHEVSAHFAHAPVEISEAGSLWLECALDGKVLYESGNAALGETLAELRTLIAEGHWTRRYAYGQPYWVREEK